MLRVPPFRLLAAVAVIASASTSLAAPRVRHSDHWRFGGQCDFSWDADLALTTSTNTALPDHAEGTSTWSNPITGQLRITSNGIDAFGVNGAGALVKISTEALGGDTSLAQPIIVPRPGFANRFYVLASQPMAAGTRKVTEFDLGVAPGAQVGPRTDLAGTNGGIEGMAAIFAPDGRTIWLVTATNGSSALLVFPVTAAGIGPAVTHALAVPVPFDQGFSFVASPNGKKLAYFASSTAAARSVVLFDFNPVTGVPSAPVAASPLAAPITAGSLYGGAFSPDGSKLYFHLHQSAPTRGAIVQMDLANANQTTLLGFGPSQTWSGLGLGPDGKIYVSGSQILPGSTSNVSVVNTPNVAGAGAGFVATQVVGCITRLGLQISPANVTALSAFDTDGDGVADGGDADADGDGIPNGIELGGDFAGDGNGNGIPDYIDATLQIGCVDAEPDGTCDVIPAKFDVDGDGIPNHLDLESDGDGVLDIVENGNAALDANGDGKLDDLTDGDHDGLPASVDADDADAAVVTTKTPAVDTDGDGTIDSLDTDSDGDCVPDADLREAGGNRIDPALPTPGGECAVADGGTDGGDDAGTTSSSGGSSGGSSSGASGGSSGASGGSSGSSGSSGGETSSSGGTSGASGNEGGSSGNQGEGDVDDLGVDSLTGGSCSASDGGTSSSAGVFGAAMALAFALVRRKNRR